MINQSLFNGLLFCSSRSVQHSSVRHYYIHLLRKTWAAWQQVSWLVWRLKITQARSHSLSLELQRKREPAGNEVVLNCQYRRIRVRHLAGVIASCSWARHLIFTVPLFSQLYNCSCSFILFSPLWNTGNTQFSSTRLDPVLLVLTNCRNSLPTWLLSCNELASHSGGGRGGGEGEGGEQDCYPRHATETGVKCREQ